MQKTHLEVIKSHNKNFLVTIAIGSKCYRDWRLYAKDNWIKYCKKHSLGLIVILKDLIDKKNFYWKKPTWQKMLLAQYLKSFYKSKIKNICYLDTDILINPFSPNIFKHHKQNKISLISETYNLPYDLNIIRKKISFYRNKYYSKKYPLDSSLFMSVKQKYQFHNLKPQKDYACAGVFVVNVKKFSKTMKNWFYKYTKDIKTLTGGGDEPLLNYELFNTKKINLIDYKFQALWLYEMAHKYSFLYQYGKKKNKIIKMCIEETIANNYFLHFAGSWYEGRMWKIKNIFKNYKTLNNNKKFAIYLKKKFTGKAKGRIIPK